MLHPRLRLLAPVVLAALLSAGCSGRSTASEREVPPLSALHVLGDSFVADPGFQASLREALPGVDITYDGVGRTSLAEQSERFARDSANFGVPLVILDGGLAQVDGEPLPHVEKIVSRLTGECRRWLYVEPVERAYPQARLGSAGYNRQLDWVGAIKARYPRHYLPTMDTFLKLEPRTRRDERDIANGWIGWSWRKDPVHLNAEGYAILARSIASTLQSGGGFSCEDVQP